MKELRGDLWVAARGEVVCITTNGDVNKTGRAVMGRGTALQAATRFPWLRGCLGHSLDQHGNQVQQFEAPGYRALVTFPVKVHFFEEASPSLIANSAAALWKLANKENWKKVYLPRPGCANGRLNWEDVKPIIDGIFDDRFYVVQK